MAKKELHEMDREGMFCVFKQWRTELLKWYGGSVDEYHKILVDPETRVMYHAVTIVTTSCANISTSATFDALLNPNGTPRVYGDPIE